MTDLVKMLNDEAGQNYHANFDGAWDRYKVVKAKEMRINRGHGFEYAAAVVGREGMFIYFAPYSLDSVATKGSMLGFFADGALFIKDLIKF